MSDPKVIIEGEAKYRDNRKWRSRWCVLTKLSPAADCVSLQIFKDSKIRFKKGQSKASLLLENFLALEDGFTLDKENHTIAIICQNLVVILAFVNKETLIQWQVKLKSHLPEVEQFLVQITHLPSKSKLTCGPARLHVKNWSFTLIHSTPPKLGGFWQLSTLRRYGIYDGKFCFEGGSSSGKDGEGLHVLQTNQSDQLLKAFQSASSGELNVKKRISIRKNHISPQKSLSSSSASSSSGKRLESDSRLLDRCYGSNSGSDGSNCDACSEIIRMQCCANHDDSDCLSEDSFPFRTSLTASSSVCCASAVETNNSSLSQALNLTKLSNELSVLGKENLEKNKIPIALVPADSGAIQNLLVMAIPSCNYCGKNCHLKTFNNNANFLSEKCNSNNHSQIVNIKSLSSCVPESDYMAINGNTNSNHLMNYAKENESANISCDSTIHPQAIQNSCLLRRQHCHDQIQQHNHYQMMLNHPCYHTHFHLYKNNQNGCIHSDRTSLCSSSSRSSCTSSNGSGSKYQLTDYSSISKPARTELPDSWYDTPKNVNQVILSETVEKINPACTCKPVIGNQQTCSENNNKISSSLMSNSNYVNCKFLPFDDKNLLNERKTGESLVVEGHYQVPRPLIENMTVNDKEKKT